MINNCEGFKSFAITPVELESHKDVGWVCMCIQYVNIEALIKILREKYS